MLSNTEKVFSNKNDSFWITQDVKLLKSFMFDMIEISNLNPDNIPINEFVLDIKNKYNLLLSKTKSDHYTNIISSSLNRSKTMWNVVNKERGKNNTPHVDFTDIVLSPDGRKFSSKKDVVNVMNARFLAAATACGAPPANISRAIATLRSARKPALCSLRLQPFTAKEVHRLITSRIPPKVSKDAYSISMRLLRTAATPLAFIFAELFNRCMSEGMYPDPMKISKVVPIFKGKGKKTDIDSYRPVSIIPAVSKVFENGLSSRLTSFLVTTAALSDRQYAYREGRSTTSLTREMVRRVVAAREDRKQVAILCCDLSKAFDVADHAVLAKKLSHYGIVGKAHNLLISLLQNRSQTVVGDGGTSRSELLGSTMGVAQGSSISNLLFLMLLNDLPDAVTTAEILMYADDVVAIVTASSVDCLERKLNKTAAKLAEWFSNNGLALNLKKTHFLQFDLSGRSRKPLSVLVEGIKIGETKSSPFLGFEIDSALTWNNHADKLCAKIGSACFALKRVSRLASAEVARTCYFATVHSLLQYGAEIWGQCSEWKRVFRLQKRAIRAIVQVSQDTSVRPYFKSLRVLTLPAIIILQMAMDARKNLEANETPDPNFSGGKVSLVKAAKLTHVMGPTVYNKLPSTVTAAPSLKSFKFRLQRWLIEHSFYDVREFLLL